MSTLPAGQLQKALEAQNPLEGLGPISYGGSHPPVQLTAADAKRAAELVHTTARVARQPIDRRGGNHLLRCGAGKLSCQQRFDYGDLPGCAGLLRHRRM